MIAVSRSNLEIVRTMVDAANRRAFDEASSFWDPTIVVRQWDRIDPSTYVGVEPVLAFFRDWLDTFEGRILVEIEEEFEQDEWALICLVFRWRGRGSDVEAVARTWWAHRFRDGRVAEIEIHIDRDEAMTAAGIRPD